MSTYSKFCNSYNDLAFLGCKGSFNCRHSDGTLDTLLHYTQDGGNRWIRQTILIQDVQDQFSIVIEGIAGLPGFSDMAVDDVVFHYDSSSKCV